MKLSKLYLTVGSVVLGFTITVLALKPSTETGKVDSTPLEPVELRFNHGKLLRDNLALEEAQDVFVSLIDSLSILHRDSLIAEVQIELAKLLIEQGKFQTAISTLEEQSSPDTELGILAQHAAMFECLKSEAWIRSGRYLEAESAINRCKLIESKLAVRQVNIQAYSAHLHGFLYQLQGIYSKALDYLQSALTIKSAEFGIESLEYASTLNNIANIYYELGLTEKAISIHYQVLEIREKELVDNHPKLAATYGNLGNSFHQEGDFLKALEYHESALRVWNEIYGSGHIESAYTYNNLGISHLSNLDLNLAQKAFEKAIEIKTSVLGEKHRSTLSTKLLLAEVFEKSGELQNAKLLNNFVSAQFSSSETKYNSTYLEAQIQLARILAKEGRIQDSKNLFKETIRAGTQIQSPLLPKWINDLAELYLNESEFQSAISVVQSSLNWNAGLNSVQQFESNPMVGEGKDTFQIIRSLEIKSSAFVGLYKISRELSSLIQALKTYERALEIGIYSRRLQTSREPEKTLTQSLNRIVSGGIDTANILYTHSNDETYLGILHKFIEFNTSGRFIDLLSDAQARNLAHIPDSLKTKELELKNRLAALDRSIVQAARVENASDTFSSIQHDRFITKKSIDDLVAYTERIYPRYHSLKHGSLYTSLDNTISTLARDNELIIQYYFSEGFLWSIALSSSHIKRYKLDSQENIQKLINKFLSVSDNKFTQVYFDQLHLLYNSLFLPIATEEEFDELLIFPYGSLNRVPFEALLKEKVVVETVPEFFASKYPFISKDYPITVGLSATLMIQQTEMQLPEFDRELLAFGPVFDFEDDFSASTASFLKSVRAVDQLDQPYIEPLFGSESELMAIGDIIDDSIPWWKKIFSRPTDIYLREEATEYKFKHSALSKYNTVHFATHSFADEVNPVNSGILLEMNPAHGEDGVLHASEIFGLNLNAELVVMSSCDSAFEFSDGFEGLSGFTKGFIYAGAKNVIASLWPSDDIATNMLMRLFYTHRRMGMNIAESLRVAKLRMMRSPGPISHPYYWAGFVHIGANAEQSDRYSRFDDLTLAEN